MLVSIMMLLQATAVVMMMTTALCNIDIIGGNYQLQTSWIYCVLVLYPPHHHHHRRRRKMMRMAMTK